MSNPLILFITSSKDDNARLSLDSFIAKCKETEFDHLDLKILTPDLLLSSSTGMEKSTETREILMTKGLEKIVTQKKNEKNIKNSKKEKEKERERERDDHNHHTIPRCFLLYNYPTTESELLALMDSRFKYPLLDGIIRVVHKNNSSLIR